MTRRRRNGLVVVAGILLIGAGGLVFRSRNRPLPVLAARVATQDIVSKVTANGKIQAENRVEMSALVQGQIVNLAVREGDRVRKGDFLLQIDRNRAAAEEAGSSAALRASLADRDTARATLEQAERDFDRARRNYEARITPEAEFQRVESALHTAHSAFEAAENRVGQMRAGVNANRDTLSKTTVRAPIDGVVTTLRVKAGESFIPAVLLNFSRNGVMFESAAPYDAGSSAECVISAPQLLSRDISFSFRVRYCQPRGGSFEIGAEIEILADATWFDIFTEVHDFIIARKGAVY